MNNPENLRPSRSDQTVILIAEDDVMVANVARIALENDGHFILTASDGEEALSIARRYTGAIDILLTDIKMPGMDGLKLREYMLADRPEIKVLLMSGETEVVGNLPVLRKPFLPRDLRARIRQTISLGTPNLDLQ